SRYMSTPCIVDFVSTSQPLRPHETKPQASACWIGRPNRLWAGTLFAPTGYRTVASGSPSAFGSHPTASRTRSGRYRRARAPVHFGTSAQGRGASHAGQGRRGGRHLPVLSASAHREEIPRAQDDRLLLRKTATPPRSRLVQGLSAMGVYMCGMTVMVPSQLTIS